MPRRRPTAPALAATSLLALCVASSAWSQTPPPQAVDGETVPVAHGNRAVRPPGGERWEMRGVQTAPTEGSSLAVLARPPAATSTFVLHPFSWGETLPLVGVGAILGLTGGIAGAIVGIPAAALDWGQGFFGITYLGYSVVASMGVFVVGGELRHDGNFFVTLVGAVGGATLGWSIQYKFFAPGDEPPVFSAMLITALLSATGAAVGYSISASLPPHHGPLARLVPTAHPLRDGAVLGLGGTF